MKKIFIVLISFFLMFVAGTFSLKRESSDKLVLCPPSDSTERSDIELTNNPKEVIDQDINKDFYNKEEKEKEKLIDQSTTTNIRELSVNFSKGFMDIEEYQDLYRIIRVYYVSINYKKEEDSENYYKIYVLGLKNNRWEIAKSIPAPLSIVANSPYRFGTKEEEEALKKYE